MTGLAKQGINIPFGIGIDSKTDPKQVQMGKMLELNNAVFNTDGLLSKRNGFGFLPASPNDSIASITTLRGNLVGTGSVLSAYNQGLSAWTSQGMIKGIDLTAVPVVRNSASQTRSDSVTASNGNSLVVWQEGNSSFYKILDTTTAQAIVQQTALPATARNPHALILGRYYIISYLVTVTTSTHLRYIAIPIVSPSAPLPAADIATNVSSLDAGYDAIVANNNIYFAYDANDVGDAVRLIYMTSTFAVSPETALATRQGDMISAAVDSTGTSPVVWFSMYDAATKDTYATARSATMLQVLAPTLVLDNIELSKLTSYGRSGALTLYYSTVNTYSYNSTRTDFISSKSVTMAGAVGAATVIRRSLALASKAFLAPDSKVYMLGTYGDLTTSLEPTYFLIDQSGNIVMKLAQANAGGYLAGANLPSVSVNDGVYQVSYIIRTLLQPVNKNQGATEQVGIYNQTGVNIASIEFDTKQSSSEIADSLHLIGGFVWQYDGVKPVEHSFSVYPEQLALTPSNGAGTLTAQQYFYAATYEWTDAAGLIHRSAPSQPIGHLLVGPNDTITVNVPTLRLTAKVSPNPVRIVLYRWSTAQQTYYQVTSVTAPVANSTTTDSVTIVDVTPDSGIIGNNIMYTNGGVVENIAAPATFGTTLFKNRLFSICSENRNLLWYSKPVVEGEPVEMSDLFTIYVAPTLGAQGDSGDITVLSAMDDKLIIFKRDSVYYVTGDGPDVTGGGGSFSEPIFISGTVGCSNPDSPILTPSGIMFQSDKGIWLLGRDLSTTYIGADVQGYNSGIVNSSVVVPGTNQVRFTLDTGLTLMYDYFARQWGTFTGAPAVSSTLYQGLHTMLDSYGRVLQETPGLYLDGTKPVTIHFKTAWIKLTNLQGFQRAYMMFLLGEYISPHKLSVDLSYDYSEAVLQTTKIKPTNFTERYGNLPLYGSENYGGTGSVEQWRIFFNRQKCQAVQITVQEAYDASLGEVAGAGLTLSGINVVVGTKLGYPKLKAKASTG